MANTMAVALTQAGVAQARKTHPENTKRKAVSLQLRDTKEQTYTIHALGGAELTISQVKAQFQAHWTLTRKQAGSKRDNPSGRGIYANAYSDAIVKETKAILDRAGIRKL